MPFGKVYYYVKVYYYDIITIIMTNLISKSKCLLSPASYDRNLSTNLLPIADTENLLLGATILPDGNTLSVCIPQFQRRPSPNWTTT